MNPKFEYCFITRGNVFRLKGDFDQALQDFDEALSLRPDHPLALNSKAWLLATCPVARCRDGTKAVEVATQAVEQDKGDLWCLDTLAAAHAEAGDFDKAVEIQVKILRDQKLNKTFDEEFRQRLELYKKKKPYRDPLMR